MNEKRSSNQLLDAALQHLAFERTVAVVLPVPDTDPPLYVAVGLLEGLRTVLAVAGPGAAPVRAAPLADLEHDHSEGGHHD